MAYNPISGAAIQYVTSAGNVASGYYLKFYIANTTTPLSMATDATGGTLLVKCKLNDKGYPISNPADNTTVFIPHVNASYRFVLYVNEADADANTTANADVNIPDIAALVGVETIGTGAGQLPDNLEVAAMVHGGQFMTYGGTADAITLASVNTVALTALATGDLFRARITTINAGAATALIDGIGSPLTCKTKTGAALPAGYFRTDVDTTFVYDGTDVIVSREVERGTGSVSEYTKSEDGTYTAWGLSTNSITAQSSFTDTITLDVAVISASTARVDSAMVSTIGGGEFINYISNVASTTQISLSFLEFGGVARTGSGDVGWTLNARWY